MARVLVASNSTWNLTNFRGGLISELVRVGHEVITSSPDLHGVQIDGVQLRHKVCRLDRSSINPLKEIAYFLQMLRILQDEKPDFFLGFTIKPNIYGSIACRLLKIASIPNVSGLGTAFLGSSALRRATLLLYRPAFRKTKAVFFQNADDASFFVKERVVRPEQVRLIPGSGVNLREFSPTALPQAPKFLLVARLLVDKGVREYVAAARKVRTKYPEATFFLLGDLDNQNRSAIGQEELEEWVREGSVEYLGATSDVRPFVRNAAAVVLPSYREGLPRTLLEAAAMGRPLIGTDVPGCRQVIREGVTGFLCQARNTNSLAAAMEKFANTKQESRQRMGANARAMAEDEFDENRVFEAYLAEIGLPTARSEVTR